MRRELLTLCILLVTSGAALSATSKAPDGSASKIALTKAALTRTLKDPESVRFRDVNIKWNSVCGYFNAKNSYGGYVGFKRFYAIDGEVLRIEDESFDQNAWEHFCGASAPKPETTEPFHEKWMDQ